jgi:hypothetical protein
LINGAECLSLVRKVCVVIPAFLSDDQKDGFMAFMLSIFGEESVSFVIQPEADLTWYTHKAKL